MVSLNLVISAGIFPLFLTSFHVTFPFHYFLMKGACFSLFYEGEVFFQDRLIWYFSMKGACFSIIYRKGACFGILTWRRVNFGILLERKDNYYGWGLYWLFSMKGAFHSFWVENLLFFQSVCRMRFSFSLQPST